MGSKVRGYIRNHHLSLLCLFLLLGGGTAYAADKIGGKDIKRGAVKTKHVRDFSLLAKDFAPGELPTGANTAPTGTNAAPAGAVMFFNLAACPSGWSELTAARGRYLVGLPAGGTLAGAFGTALANGESRAVGQHNHSVSDPGHAHGVQHTLGETDGAGGGLDRAIASATSLSTNTQVATTGLSVNNSGAVAGTNAPYVQLLVCQKS